LILSLYISGINSTGCK
jgi:hypothetical protein